MAPTKPDAPLACPREGAMLAKESRWGVTVDECPRCGGLWFDGKELAMLAGEELARAARPDRRRSASFFACPRCAGDCVPTEVGGVEIDVCTSCHGVWLDAGELEAAKRGVADRQDARSRFLAWLRRAPT